MAINEILIDQAGLLETAENLHGNHSWIRELIKFGITTNQEVQDRFQTQALYKQIKEFLGRSRGEVVRIRETLPSYQLGMLQPALEAVLKDADHVLHIEFDPSSDPTEQGYFPMKTNWNITQLALKMAIDGWITADGHRILTRYGTEQQWVVRIYRNVPTFSIFALPEQIRLAEQIMEQVVQWTKDHNYYRGKKITPHGDFISLERKYTWDDIVLEPNIQQELIENVVDFIKYIPLYQANQIPLKRGLILHGQPGVGKTLVGKVLANAVDCTFIWVTNAHIEGPQSVTDLFTFARELHPCIIFFEDLDFFGKERNSNAYSPVLGELMVQMDGLIENDGVFVIATTNALEKIEPALKDRPSRFDRVLEFKSPNPEMRKKIIARILLGKTANGINIDYLTEKTEGFTGAYLQELVILATKVAIEQKDYDESNIVKLTDTHFEIALNQVQKKKEKSLGFGCKS